MITVNTAIQKGHWMVTYPCAVLFIGGNISAFYLADLQHNFPNWIAITFMMIFSFSSAWLWWSFFIVKWKIWAFSNVRNVHELK